MQIPARLRIPVMRIVLGDNLIHHLDGFKPDHYQGLSSSCSRLLAATVKTLAVGTVTQACSDSTGSYYYNLNQLEMQSHVCLVILAR